MKNLLVRSALALLSCTLAFAPESSASSDFIHARSALLTEAVADTSFGIQTSPVLRETTTGYCVAWRDTRQGGAIMAARIDKSGKLLDPFGIPVSPVPAGSWAPWRVEVISGEGRSLVTYGEGTRVMGRIISVDGAPEPTSRELFDATIGTWQVTATDGERALISVHHPWGLRLVLVDVNGAILWSQSVETDYYQLRAVIRDTTALVLVQPGTRSGNLDLWRVDGEGAVRYDTSVRSSEIYHWGVVDEEDALLVIDLDPSGTLGPIRFDRISDTGEVITSASAEQLPELGLIYRLWRQDDGSVRVLSTTEGGLILLEIRGTEAFEVARIPGIHEATISADPSPISLWTDPQTRRLRYGFGLPAEVPGEPITASARVEIVADATPFSGMIATLWVELSLETGTQRLIQGFVERDGLTLVDQVEISTGTTIVASNSEERLPRAAIASRGGILQMAWIEGSELLVRRRDSGGSWLGESETISSTANLLHPEGLIAIEDGFFLTWSDRESPETPGFSRLRAAWIRQDGTVELIDIEEPEQARGHQWPSALLHGNRILVVSRIPHGTICQITCPAVSYDVHLWSVTPDDGLKAISTPELVVTSVIPTLASRGDHLLMIGDTETRTFRLSGDALVAQNASAGSPAIDGRAIGWRDRFLVYGRRSGTGATSQTLLATIDPRDDELSLYVATEIPDASDSTSFRFLPALVRLGETIYIVGSEVSLEADEAMVRRVRIHELVPVETRRRGISRP